MWRLHPKQGPLGLVLDGAAHDELRRRCDAAANTETRTRYQMVLLAGEGWSAVAVAGLVGRSPDTVWRVVGDRSVEVGA